MQDNSSGDAEAVGEIVFESLTEAVRNDPGLVDGDTLTLVTTVTPTETLAEEL